MRNLLLCSLILLFVQFTSADKPSIVGRWSNLYTETTLGKSKDDKESVEFFANGKYLWVSEYLGDIKVHKGAYDYKNGLLICYLADERIPYKKDERNQSKFYHISTVRFLSKNTIEFKTTGSMWTTAVYERKN